MHRMLHPHKKPSTDHLNRYGLDNGKSNVEPCTAKSNANNRKLRVDNTSGENAIDWVGKPRKGRPHYRVRWCDEDGKEQSKRFYPNDLGTMDATRKAAVRYRDEVYVRTGNTNGMRPAKRRKTG